MYVFERARVYVCVRACVRACVCVCVSVRVSGSVHASVYAGNGGVVVVMCVYGVSVCACVHYVCVVVVISVCVCMHVCVRTRRDVEGGGEGGVVSARVCA